ncbi:hypothetical protein NDU88_001600 [Pleurodeles waltl]|uniref:Uncharacterized protein n=1 Tax=Pleurodeles waltl TaxID=8319 RepID=A0AAV7KZ12_PLEWA|nr:hypothetical protein NDU88_001600 [Pleurodeles waltl]
MGLRSRGAGFEAVACSNSVTLSIVSWELTGLQQTIPQRWKRPPCRSGGGSGILSGAAGMAARYWWEETIRSVTRAKGPAA